MSPAMLWELVGRKREKKREQRERERFRYHVEIIPKNATMTHDGIQIFSDG